MLPPPSTLLKIPATITTSVQLTNGKFLDSLTTHCFTGTDDFFFLGSLWYLGSYKRQPCLCAPDQLVPSFVQYTEVYVIDKTWCEYEPNQTSDYAANWELITSKTPVNSDCFNIMTYSEQQQTTGHVDKDCHQFLWPANNVWFAYRSTCSISIGHSSRPSCHWLVAIGMMIHTINCIY